MTEPPFRHLYLVDGSGYIFRAYFALPPITTKSGTPTGAVYGFTNMLLKLLRERDVEGLAVVFDAGAHTFRNDLFDGYKAQRPEPPEDLVPQFALIREAARAFGLPTIELDGWEADDVIATLARRAREAGVAVTIVSSDKDLMQLVRDGVDLLDPIKQKPIGAAEVEEKFGVPPALVADVQALAGDSVDNVPGVPGIGVKTAAELIRTFGDLETLLSRAGEIKQPKRRERLQEFAEQARLSRRLVTLSDEVPLAESLDVFVKHLPDPETLREFLERMEFRSLLGRLPELLGEAAAATPAAASAAAVPASAEAAPAATPTAGVPAGGYRLVQDEAELAACIEAARAAGRVAVDTETTSLDPQVAELVGFSLSYAEGEGCYVPVGHKAPDAGEGLDFAGSTPPKQVPLARALALLKPLLADEAVLKIGQNLKYDMRVLGRYGLTIAPYDDTMLLSYALDAGKHGHGMDELSERHLDHKPISYDAVTGTGKARVTFDKVPLDKALAYAAEDADVTFRLWRFLKPRLPLERVTTVYETLERPLVPVLAEMEAHGIRVDREVLRRLSNDFAGRLEALEQEIHRLAGRPFTIGSPKQLGEILFTEMNLDGGGRKGKSGTLSTGADILESLAAQGHELPRKVLDWRQLAKLKSTYTDALQQQIDPATGRVHTCYAQAVASTGRLSSTDPNLQNIPIRTEEGRKIRAAFVAEAGHRLLSVDYSQIELRLTAHIAEVPALRQAFADGLDIHAMTASEVFGVPLDRMDPETRRRAKAINFGIIYGISAFGLANNLGIPQGEARAFIEAYFARFPGIRAYMDSMRKLGREQGYVTTLFGRKIHVPALQEKNPARRAFGERAAINAPIQGTAADIIKRAMVRVGPALREAGLSARLLLQVHDELLFEVPEAEVEASAAVAKAVMEGACAPVLELSVPLIADVGVGESWAAAH